MPDHYFDEQNTEDAAGSKLEKAAKQAGVKTIRDMQGTQLQYYKGKLMHPNEIKRLRSRGQ